MRELEREEGSGDGMLICLGNGGLKVVLAA